MDVHHLNIMFSGPMKEITELNVVEKDLDDNKFIDCATQNCF